MPGTKKTLNTSAILMPPLPDGLCLPAVPNTVLAATPPRSAKAELQSAVDLRATTTEIAARKADLGARTANKKCFEALLKKECRKENELRQN